MILKVKAGMCAFPAFSKLLTSGLLMFLSLLDVRSHFSLASLARLACFQLWDSRFRLLAYTLCLARVSLCSAARSFYSRFASPAPQGGALLLAPLVLSHRL